MNFLFILSIINHFFCKIERSVHEWYYLNMKNNDFFNSISMHDFDDNARTCGQRIRNAREKKGLSIQEFANLLKRDYSFVVKYETDNRKPKDDLLIEMSNILGISPLYLKYGQYYDEIDDFGGIAIHYYTNTKFKQKDKDVNTKNIEELKQNINFLFENKNNQLDYIKILKDISNNLIRHKQSNSKEFRNLVKKTLKK